MRKTCCSTFEHRRVKLPSVCFSCSFNLSERMVYSRSSSSMTLRTFSTCIRSRSYIEQETIGSVLFAINRRSPYWCDHDSCDSCSRFDVRVSSWFLRAKPSWKYPGVFSVEISMLLLRHVFEWCPSILGWFVRWYRSIDRPSLVLRCSTERQDHCPALIVRILPWHRTARSWHEARSIDVPEKEKINACATIPLVFLPSQVDGWRSDLILIGDVSNPISFVRNYPWTKRDDKDRLHFVRCSSADQFFFDFISSRWSSVMMLLCSLSIPVISWRSLSYSCS